MPWPPKQLFRKVSKEQCHATLPGQEKFRTSVKDGAGTKRDENMSKGHRASSSSRLDREGQRRREAKDAEEVGPFCVWS